MTTFFRKLVSSAQFLWSNAFASSITDWHTAIPINHRQHTTRKQNERFGFRSAWLECDRPIQVFDHTFILLVNRQTVRFKSKFKCFDMIWIQNSCLYTEDSRPWGIQTQNCLAGGRPTGSRATQKPTVQTRRKRITARITVINRINPLISEFTSVIHFSHS